MRKSRAPGPEKVWELLDISLGADSCWIWAGKSTHGYGWICLAGHGRKKIMIHRLMLEQKLGRPLMAGMFALHRCGNSICGNPFHLYEGTQKDNVADAIRHGRWTPYHPQPKKTHCPKGHPYSGANLLPGKHQRCRICRKATKAAAYQRARLKAALGI